MNIHDLFIKHSKIHTVTILMKDLWESRGVWEWLMTTPNLDIALHGWEHEDYSKLPYQVAKNDIACCLQYWKENTDRMGYNIPLKVFYPPWNKVSNELIMALGDLGLELNDCIDETKVYNLHWWEYIGGRNLDKLEAKLIEG